DRYVTRNTGTAIDEVVPDDTTDVVVRRHPIDQAECDFSLTIDERVAFGESVRRAVPHQDGWSGQLTLRRPNVAEKRMSDHPVASSNNVHSVGVIVPARAVELDDGVLDHAVIDSGAVCVRIRLDELLAGVDET